MRGPANVAFKEEAHILTEQFKHGDKTSELIQIQAEAPGKELNPSVQYTLPVPNAPVGDELSVRLWVARTGRACGSPPASSCRGCATRPTSTSR